jgi:catechol 2,3-dioxygenase-like lactoylglutathione lyase family enzyme
MLPAMLTGIDHVIVVVADPDQACAELERELGLRAGGGGRHEAYGSFNRLVWLGDSYIEVLGISDRRLAEQAWFGAGALQVLDSAGAGYVGLSLVSDDLGADMRVLREQGSRLGDPVAGQRVRPDGGVVRWHVSSADEPDPELGYLFLIEHDSTGAEWTPADRDRRAAEEHPLGGPVRLERVELPVDDLRATTTRLHRDLGVAFRPSLAGGGARDTSVGRQTLRLVTDGPGRLPTVALRGGSAPREVELFGCRWVVRPVAG